MKGYIVVARGKPAISLENGNEIKGFDVKTVVCLDGRTRDLAGWLCYRFGNPKLSTRSFRAVIEFLIFHLGLPGTKFR